MCFLYRESHRLYKSRSYTVAKGDSYIATYHNMNKYILCTQNVTATTTNVFQLVLNLFVRCMHYET